MSVLLILIPLSIVIAGGFLAAFIWAVRSGQFDDTCTPSLRVLLNDAVAPVKENPIPPRLTERRLHAAPNPQQQSQK